MKVSIVMLAFNHERFIKNALDSILMQKTQFEYEVIIGEDCSKDTTKEIIKSYETKFNGRLKPIYRTKNLGMIKNLLDCYEHCTGDYIAMLEGDDYWLDADKIEIQLSFLEGHKEYVACTHDWNIVDINGKFMEQGGRFSIFQEYTLDNWENFEIPGQTATIVFRNIYQTIKSKYEWLVKRYMWIPMDRTGILLLLQYGKIARLPKVMSCYRSYIETRGSNWSSKRSTNWLYFYFMILGMEFLAKKIGTPVNCMYGKSEVFLKNYLAWRFYSKELWQKVLFFFQGMIMFIIQPHRITMLRQAKALRQAQKQGQQI